MPPITSRIAVIAVETLQAVALSLLHNWLALSLAIVIAAAMKVHADPRRLERAMAKRTHAAILGSVLLGALTPLCACGTMAVILGMLSATVPWAPIMAFLTSSPLMSPDGFVLLTGIIGLDFAVAVAVASVVIGVGSGYVTHLVERRTGFLKNQTRFATKGEGGACDGALPATATAASAAACACAAAAPATSAAASSRAVTTAVPLTACCAAAAAVSSPATAFAASVSALLAQVTRVVAGLRVPDVVRALQDVGARQILLSFAIFVAVGHLINRLVPVELIGRLFGSGHAYSVPFAALVGLPFYVTTESSVPIIQALMKSGASPGAMLSFMITGPATSAWVIAGLSTFLRPRAILFYVGLVLAGGILSGYGYEAFLALR